MSNPLSPVHYVFVLGLTALLGACGGGDTSVSGSSDVTVASATADTMAGQAGKRATKASAEDDTAYDEEPMPAEFATPRVAVLDYSTLNTMAKRSRLSPYNLAIIGIDTQQGPAYLRQVVAGIKGGNPDIKIAQYSIVSEIRDDMTAQAAALSANDWWLHNTASERVQWITAYGAYEANLTDWAPANAAGQRWPQWKAANDATMMFRGTPQVDYVFTDSVHYPTVVADWKRNGTNQTSTDAAVQQAIRLGYKSYWDTLRGLVPSLKMMGNIHPELLASGEIKGKLEGAFLEGMMGKSYSYETWAGWTRMMEVYRAALANTAAPHTVVFQIYTDSPTNYAFVRYGMTSALLADGYFCVNKSSDLNQAMPWYDEFSAPLGAAVDAPPSAPTANSIWSRRFENGIVLVNPGPAAASINVGSGYQRLTGELDTVVNNGAVENGFVTLQPKQGLVLVKRS